MSLIILKSLPEARLKTLRDHFGKRDDPREAWRVAHPLPEALLLVVCGRNWDCEDNDEFADRVLRIVTCSVVMRPTTMGSVGLYGVPVALEGERPQAFRLITVEMNRPMVGSLFGGRRMPV